MSLVSCLKELEDENQRLKKLYADVQLQAGVLKEAITKKW
jgi:putative transposase